MSELNSPNELSPLDKAMNAGDTSSNKVRMKKELGLLEGVSIILGIIFGSGIFISPRGVLAEAGSPGFSIVVWVLCGFLSMIGALCYAELGTSIPKSGGDYAYIFEAFGPLPAFLYLWAAMFIFVPCTNAIMGLTFASYVIQPFFPDCAIPTVAVRLLAAVSICFLTFLNCYDVRLTTRLQNVFMFTKLAALGLIIVSGLVYICQGNLENFDHFWDKTITDPGRIAVAFYAGIFSYSGWSYLNFMTEELRDPYVNLPRAIYISLPIVTIIYVLANIAYLSVLTTTELLASGAIAVTYSNISLGWFSWIMPVMVAISAFGGLSVHIMTSSRMCFVGARYGHFPAMLSHIHITKFTPTPSLIFLMILSLLYLCIDDVYVLITYSSIVESFFLMLTVSGILHFRRVRPNMVRPIKVHIIVPITFVLICAFLVLVPCYRRPFEVGMGVVITVIGIPIYCVCVKWQNKPQWFNNSLHQATYVIQKLFISAKEEA